jgi:putative oxidoreductase
MAMNFIKAIQRNINLICGKLPEDLILLLTRVAIANVFWRSVQTKINGWEIFDQSFQFYNLGSNAITLFRYEYDIPILSYTQAAYTATFAEFFFSIMLVIGLGTRIAALGLLGVTAVIQIFVYPEAWPTHILWFAALLYLLKHGGGRIALEKLAISVEK